MKITLFITMINFLFYFSPLQVTHSWKGSDLPGKSYAEFKDLSGKQSFKIVVPASAKKVKLKYEISRVSGELQFIIKSSSHTVLSKNIVSDETDEITFDKAEKEDFKFYLVGKKAEGKYTITYSAEQ